MVRARGTQSKHSNVESDPDASRASRSSLSLPRLVHPLLLDGKRQRTDTAEAARFQLRDRRGGKKKATVGFRGGSGLII